MHARLSWSISVSAILGWLVVMASCSPPDDPPNQARGLERRILAPCCFRQTLEDHDSDVARMLRAEIQARTSAGDQSAAIEDDLARRYGERVRAMPRDLDPRALLGVALGVVLTLGALVIVRFMCRRPVEPATTVPFGDNNDLDYQERIDDEILDLD